MHSKYAKGDHWLAIVFSVTYICEISSARYIYTYVGDDRKTCRVYRATIPLSFLQISDLYTVPTRFYESLNEKNQMCELCMLSQIWSHNNYYFSIIIIVIEFNLL